MIKSLNRIIKQTINSFKKFPVEVILAFVITVLAIVLVETDGSYFYLRMLAPLMIAFVYGILSSFVVALTDQKLYKTVLIKIVPFLIGGAYYLYLPALEDNIIGLNGIYYAIIIVLGLVLIGTVRHLNLKDDQVNFWNNSQDLLKNLLETVVFSGVMAIGINLILGALDFLFGVNITYHFYMRSWQISFGIFGSMYFLGNTSKSIQNFETYKYAKSLKVLGLYIILSLLVVYGLILYVYFAKVLVVGGWPEYGVAWFIIAFCMAGIFSMILISPLKKSNSSIKTIIKALSISFLPLVVLYIWAFQQRIASYGITINRYFGLALGLWFAIIALYMIFSKKQQIKYIFVFLIPIISLSTWGPWSAISVTLKQQKPRLENTLVETGLLVDGQMVSSQKAESVDIDSDVREDIRTRLRMIVSVYGIKEIQNWLSPELYDKLETDENLGVYTILDNLNINYYMDTQRNYYRLYSNNQNNLSVSGYDRLFRLSFYDSDSRSNIDQLENSNYDIYLEKDSNGNKTKLVFEQKTTLNTKSINLIEVFESLQGSLLKDSQNRFDIEDSFQQLSFEDNGLGFYIESIVLIKDSSTNTQSISNLDIILLEQR